MNSHPCTPNLKEALVPTITLNTDDFAPRYSIRFDAELRPIKVRVDLTPVLAAMAETTARRRVVIETAEKKRAEKAATDGAVWGRGDDGAIWGLAEVTPIRPAVTADDQRKAA
jgi:hypothetical protein